MTLAILTFKPLVWKGIYKIYFNKRTIAYILKSLVLLKYLKVSLQWQHQYQILEIEKKSGCINVKNVSIRT